MFFALLSDLNLCNAKNKIKKDARPLKKDAAPSKKYSTH
jgi:hypothetical protein